MATFDNDPSLKEVYEKLIALSPSDAKKILEEYRRSEPSGFPGSDEQRYKLWQILLFGVMAIAVFGVIAGTILAMYKLDATAAWVLATAATTGVLALFAKSPSDANGG